MYKNIALILPFVAGISMSLSALCFKKATEYSKLPSHFLMIKSAFIIIAILIGATPSLSFIGSSLPTLFGFIAGFLNTTSMVMWGIASSQTNPSLVSSFFTMASVTSPIITALLIKPEGTNINYNIFNFAGFIICATSVFYTSYKNKLNNGYNWMKFASVGLSACVCIEVLLFFLSLRMEGIRSGIQFIDYFKAIDSPKWYLIGLSVSTILIQIILCNKIFTKLNKKFIVLGIASGFFDIILSILTVKAIPMVDSSKLPILFAMVSAGYILGCSIWGKLVYNQKSLIFNHIIFFCGMITSALG